MSTQRYHFLTIAGQSGRELEAACEAILARRPAGASPAREGFVFDDYTPAVQARIETLCRSLIDAADALPVVHHATHVDGWAMAYHGLMSLPWPDGRGRAVGTMGSGVAVYPASQAEWFLAEAAKARRRAARSGSRFWPWYAAGVATAFEAGRWFKLDYAVAVVTECLGPSREDAEIEASQATLVPGLKSRRAHPALTTQYAAWTRQRKQITRKLRACVERTAKTSPPRRARS